jgi:membrane-associated phospholipid phosphatase
MPIFFRGLRMFRYIVLSFLTLQFAFAGTVENVGNLLLAIQTAATPGYEYCTKDDEGLREYGKSQALNVAVTLALKATVDKERPDGSGNDSFPSGHTSIAFANATHAAIRYGFNTYTILSFAMAAGVGYTRVTSDRHDSVDVAAGAAIGAASSWIFTKTLGMSGVSAGVDRDAVTVNCRYRF